MCRNCYQPLRGHVRNPETSPTSPGAVGGKDAKVFQRFRVNKEKGIDRSVPARERTPQNENLEGISAADVAGGAPGNQTKSPSPVLPAENSVSPPPPSSSALPKPRQPPVGSSEGAPSISPKSPPAVVSKPTANHAPLVAKVTPPFGLGTLSTGGGRVPSRPPPPASAILKPPPPAIAGATRGPLSPSPTPPTAPVHSPANETKTEPVDALQQLPGENDSDANKEVELKTEVIKTDISRQEEPLAKEVELKTNSADVLCSEVSESLVAESETPLREGQGECNGETVEEEGEREGEDEMEDAVEEEERVTTDAGAIVEEVMEVVEMTDSETKLECLFTEPDPTGGTVEGTENEEIGGSQISAGEEGVDGGAEEAVNETSDVMEMEREEGESVGTSLKFAVSQPTEARTDEVTELVDVAGTGPDGAMVADEEEEGNDEGDGEGTDGVMKSLKRKLSIKKKPKKTAADATENSPSTEQGIRAGRTSLVPYKVLLQHTRVLYYMASCPKHV